MGAECVETAAEAQRMDLLQWLRERGCPWDGKNHSCSRQLLQYRDALTGDAARMPVAQVYSPKVVVLQFAYYNGVPWDWNVFRNTPSYPGHERHERAREWAKVEQMNWKE